MAATPKSLTVRQREFARRAFPLLEAHLKKHGGISPMKEAAKTIGAIPISLAVEDKKIKLITVLKNYKDNSSPSEFIACICFLDWDGTRPAWLDL